MWYDILCGGLMLIPLVVVMLYPSISTLYMIYDPKTSTSFENIILLTCVISMTCALCAMMSSLSKMYNVCTLSFAFNMLFNLTIGAISVYLIYNDYQYDFNTLVINIVIAVFIIAMSITITWPVVEQYSNQNTTHSNLSDTDKDDDSGEY